MNPKLKAGLFGCLTGVLVSVVLIVGSVQSNVANRCTELGFAGGKIDWKLHGYCMRNSLVAGQRSYIQLDAITR